MTNPLTKLAKKAMGPIVRALLTSKVRAAAEGRLGDTPEARAKNRARYWWLVGKKTGTGVALLVLTALLWAYPDTAAWVPILIGPVAVALIEWGLLDKAWRNYRPLWLETQVARAIAAHSAEFGTGFTAACTWQLTQCQGDWCVALGVLLGALAYLAIHYGFLDAAWKAPAPALITWPRQGNDGRQ